MVLENLPTRPVNLGKPKGPHNRSKGKNHGKKRKPVPWEGVPQIQPWLAGDSRTVHLDGSTLEGGGQLVRVALTLSALTSIPVHITRIRAGRGGGRTSGGLKESHLAALRVLAEECGADVQGGYVGSPELLFEPDRQKVTQSAQKTVALEKPGSVWLILQALLPWYLLRGRRFELTLKGGTNVSSSMSGDYVQQVLLPLLEKVGHPKLRVEVLKRGWAGNASHIGEVKVSLWDDENRDNNTNRKKALVPFNVQTRGIISKIAITVVAHPESMRAALIEQARQELAREFPGTDVEIAVDNDSGDVRRLYLLLVAHTSGGWRLGRDYLGTGKTLKNQKETDALVDGTMRKVTLELLHEVRAGGCVDEYMQDQLVIFQALGAGISAVDAGEGREEGTLHTRTVRWVCKEMLRDFGFEVIHGGLCMGIGDLEKRRGNVHEIEENSTDEQLAGAVGHVTWEDSE